MSVPGTDPVRVFLDPAHHALREEFGETVCAGIAGRPVPDDDASARREARDLLAVLGSAGALAPIGAGDLRSVVVLRELLGAASPLADAVYALQALGGMPLVLAGSDAQRARWLDPILRGACMAAFAMTERDAGSDVGAMTTRAERDGGDWVLAGTKSFISNAGIADVYLVFAVTDPDAGRRGISCFAVPADAPGVRFLGPQILSAPHPLGEIAFEDCRIRGDHLIGEFGGGFKLGLATLDRLRPTVAAAACGMASRALDEALAHARERRQFGKLLGEFQLVQEKLARMATDLTAARLLTYRAAWEQDRGTERITLEAAMAKAFATEAAQRIVDDAVQVLGGRGVLADHPVDRLYRAVRALRIYEGTTEIQHLIIAGRLLAGDPA